MTHALIVDDEPENRYLLRALLAGHGFEVSEAGNGVEALAEARRQAPDVIVSDLLMPKMDGYTLLREWKADALLANIPFIVYTATYIEPKDEKLACDLGADAFILKPAEPEPFMRRVQEVLARAQAGVLPPHAPALDEQTACKVYSEVLVKKLEKRSIQLEQRVGELAASEERFRQLNAVLEQRIAERTAQLAAANRELEAFAYAASHDLRAPLRAIDGFSRILLEDHAAQLGETGRGHLERVSVAVRRMNELIDDLFALSMVGRQEVGKTEVDLGAMAAEILDELMRAAPRPQIETRIAARCMATGDPRLLRVLLQNLLGNAIKYTGKRTDARIEFECAEGEDGPVFSVRDNGAGFDMAQAAQLFQPFVRLHRIEDFEGTGIGLATVARIVARHGGRVWAEAEKGKGATFFFTLPGEPAAAS